MKEKYDIPYVVGIPAGRAAVEPWLKALKSGDSTYLTGLTGEESLRKVKFAMADLNAWKNESRQSDDSCDILLIGEPVRILSLRRYLEIEKGIKNIRLICPLADAPRGGITAGLQGCNENYSRPYLRTSVTERRETIRLLSA